MVDVDLNDLADEIVSTHYGVSWRRLVGIGHRPGCTCSPRYIRIWDDVESGVRQRDIAIAEGVTDAAVHQIVNKVARCKMRAVVQAVGPLVRWDAMKLSAYVGQVADGMTQ